MVDLVPSVTTIKGFLLSNFFYFSQGEMGDTQLWKRWWCEPWPLKVSPLCIQSRSMSLRHNALSKTESKEALSSQFAILIRPSSFSPWWNTAFNVNLFYPPSTARVQNSRAYSAACHMLDGKWYCHFTCFKCYFIYVLEYGDVKWSKHWNLMIKHVIVVLYQLM